MEASIFPVRGRSYRLTEGDRYIVQDCEPSGRWGNKGGTNHHGGRATSSAAPRHIDDDDDDSLDLSVVSQRPAGGYCAKLAADPELYGFIIGRQGATKSRLEQECGVKIDIPRKGSKRDAEIEIRGDAPRGVAAAYRKVEGVISGALAGPRLPYTHFVSIPLTTPEMQKRVSEFTEGIASDPRSEADWKIKPACLQSPTKFHQTVVMLKLYTKGMREAAQQVLRTFEGRFRAISTGPPQVAIRGLDIMNDDPSQCNVLFAKVEDASPGRALSKLCADVVDALAQGGVLLDKDAGSGDVKLHATLINSSFAVSGQQHQASGASTADSRRAPREPFDARGLLEEKQSSADFGLHPLECLHLSTRGSYGKDGFYLPLSVVPLV